MLGAILHTVGYLAVLEMPAAASSLYIRTSPGIDKCPLGTRTTVPNSHQKDAGSMPDGPLLVFTQPRESVMQAVQVPLTPRGIFSAMLLLWPVPLLAPQCPLEVHTQLPVPLPLQIQAPPSPEPFQQIKGPLVSAPCAFRTR